MNIRQVGLFAIPLALTLTGCALEDMGDWGSSQRFKEEFRLNYKLKSGGQLELTNLNGSIEIVSWEKDEVEVNGVKYAGSEEMLRGIKIEADSQPESLRIRTVRPESMRCNCGARYVLRVPRRVWLNGIVSSNGSIKVEDVAGEAKLRSSNGSIKLYRHNGKVDAQTSNASIEAFSLNGDFRGRTSNGSIKADGLRGAFDAETSNAGISARIEKLATGRPLHADTANGGIELVLTDYTDQAIDAETSNAGITLRLPASANFDIRASTSHGSVSHDFEVSKTGENSKDRLEGRVGKGGPSLRLSTSNGGIRIEKL